MKKEYLILALVIIALSAYLILKNTDSTHYTLPVFEELQGKNISRIDIKKSDSILSLEKSGDNWVIGTEKLPAETGKVTPMIDVISGLNLTALVSESDSYARYDLDDKNKITITAWSNGTAVREFNIGKAAASYRHTFVTIKDDKRVYHADENFRNKFDKSKNELTDKTVMEFGSETAYAIQASSEKTTFAYERKQEEVSVDVTADDNTDKTEDSSKPPEPPSKPEITWVAADGSKKDSAKISDFIKVVSALKCESYITGKKKEEFKDPLHLVTINGDKDYQLSVFKKDKKDTKYPAISSESDFPFYLDSETVDKLIDALKKI